MKKKNLILALLFGVSFSSCKKDEIVVEGEGPGTLQHEYIVSTGLLRGYIKFFPLHGDFFFDNESMATFSPLRNGKIVKLEVKILENDLNGISLLTIRKNTNNTDLSLELLPNAGPGYYTDTDTVFIKSTDELNYAYNTLDSDEGSMLIYIRTVIEYD
jgi:hypothetical protein